MAHLAEVASAAELYGRYRSARSRLWPRQAVVVDLRPPRMELKINIRTPPERPKFPEFLLENRPSFADALEDITLTSGYTLEDLSSPSRLRPLCYWRAVYVNRLWALGWNKSRIGRHINRDHTTVVYILRHLTPGSPKLEKLKSEMERLKDR